MKKSKVLICIICVLAILGVISVIYLKKDNLVANTNNEINMNKNATNNVTSSENTFESSGINIPNPIEKVERLTEKETIQKVKIYLFWADWCPHCHEFIKYFGNIYKDYEDDFEIVTYQVYLNGSSNPDNINEKLMTGISNEINSNLGEGESKLQGGVPVIIIGDKFHQSGFGRDGSDILEVALREAKSENYVDIVDKYIKSNSISTDEKTFLETCDIAEIECVK